MIILSAYPVHFKNQTPETIDNMTAAWELALDGVEYQQAQTGLQIYLRTDTKGFPPSPGQIINSLIAASETDDERIGEMTAWSLVMQALKNSGDINRAREEYNALPGIVRATVGSPENLVEWAIDENFNAEVAQGIFLRQFTNMQNRIQSEKRMSVMTDNPRLEAKAEVLQLEEKHNDVFIGGEWSEERTQQIEELRRELRQKCFTA